MTPDPTTYTVLADSLVNCVIERGNIRLTKVIAAGAFGAILLAEQTAPYPSLVAVKCIIKPSPNASERDWHFLTRELHLHKTAQGHKGVVRLHRWFEEEGYVFIVMDYYKDGDLFGMITEKQMFVAQDEVIRDAMLQVIDALMHLHSKGVYHRDLKPENILCVDEGDRLHLAIADFGLATNEMVSQEWGVGSTYYMSPECHGHPHRGRRPSRYYTPANDVWALGVLLINLACGRNPWRRADPSDSAYAGLLHDPNFLLSILPISKELNSVLKRVFIRDPLRRMGLTEFRRRLLRVERFTLPKEELRASSEVLRQAAEPLLAYYEMEDLLKQESMEMEEWDDNHDMVQLPPIEEFFAFDKGSFAQSLQFPSILSWSLPSDSNGNISRFSSDAQGYDLYAAPHPTPNPPNTIPCSLLPSPEILSTQTMESIYEPHRHKKPLTCLTPPQPVSCDSSPGFSPSSSISSASSSVFPQTPQTASRSSREESTLRIVGPAAQLVKVEEVHVYELQTFVAEDAARNTLGRHNLQVQAAAISDGVEVYVEDASDALSSMKSHRSGSSGATMHRFKNMLRRPASWLSFPPLARSSMSGNTP